MWCLDAADCTPGCCCCMPRRVPVRCRAATKPAALTCSGHTSSTLSSSSVRKWGSDTWSSLWWKKTGQQQGRWGGSTGGGGGQAAWALAGAPDSRHVLPATAPGPAFTAAGMAPAHHRNWPRMSCGSGASSPSASQNSGRRSSSRRDTSAWGAGVLMAPGDQPQEGTGRQVIARGNFVVHGLAMAGEQPL